MFVSITRACGLSRHERDRYLRQQIAGGISLI